MVRFAQILILGNGNLPLWILKALQSSSYALQCASFKESNLSFFGNYCKKQKISYTNFTQSSALKDYLSSITQECLIISANNYYIFPPEILEKNTLKIINYHNSLLPAHRGLNAQMWSIFEEDKESGITWHCVNKDIDCGDIILQKHIDLGLEYTYFTLTQEQLKSAYNAFVEIKDKILEWNFDCTKQEHFKKSTLHLKKDLPNNGFLDTTWNTQKQWAFLRSMDCQKSGAIPLPKVMQNGKIYTILNYTKNEKDAIHLTLKESNE
ncbi:formyl transferase [Helicobacter sp. MIT 11-5569]|uniref:formyltransferase family protein n=1 Tax=Helicobacter sp. MIT 11-5569 TaxID=1548151 RepID=UPI00068D229D|nr:formyltransferase family protein [Helicobacter sp. MIT 11-5569]TLD83463.1 formyl transferase [Helicobacter sp. MIT 11-5569]